MTRFTALNRFQAFSIHFFVSSIIALLSAGLVFLLWYPGLLAAATGVTKVFLILLIVDVVLGPVITLIIFNPKKEELKRDLFIVFLIQIAALLYGLHTVFIARPVYIVFSVDCFELVYANDLSEEKLKKATNKQFQSLPLMGPELIAVRRPTEASERTKILFSSLQGGDDLPQLPEYYVSYGEKKVEVIKQIQPFSHLYPFNKDREREVDQLQQKYALQKIGAGYLPLKARVRDLTIIVNKTTGEILEISDLQPWPV